MINRLSEFHDLLTDDVCSSGYVGPNSRVMSVEGRKEGRNEGIKEERKRVQTNFML